MPKTGRPPNTESQFWARVDRSGGAAACWPWTGYVAPHGYGRARLNGTQYSTHRLAYILTRGDPGELLVCHHCDNRRCCNPAHLFLGTDADNIADRDAKSRQAKGTRHGQAKLNEEAVRLIREMRRLGLSQAWIASRFGVNQTKISDIIAGRTWRHVG